VECIFQHGYIWTVYYGPAIVRRPTGVDGESSAIAEIARVSVVNLDHGTVANAILDADTVGFYGATTSWRPILNPAVGRYSTQ